MAAIDAYRKRGAVSALDMAIQERMRQQVEKGHSVEHDDAHTDGSLANAAAVYAAPALARSLLEQLWPWEGEPKFGDRLTELARAMALIMAEMDRLARAEDA